MDATLAPILPTQWVFSETKLKKSECQRKALLPSLLSLTRFIDLSQQPRLERRPGCL